MPGGKRAAGREEQEYRRLLGQVIVDLRAIGAPNEGPNMSQADLAGRINRSEAALSRYETGKATPSSFDLHQIAAVFGMPEPALKALIFPPEEEVTPVRRMMAGRAEAATHRGLAANGRERGVA